MVFFQLPLIDADTTIGDTVTLLREFGVWALIIEVKPDNFCLVDFRDLVTAPDQSQPLSAADSLPILALKDLPDALSMNRAQFHAAMSERRHEYAVREGGEDTADVFAVSEELATVFMGDAPGKRCTRPNKPAAMSSRQWYHYYPPMTPSASGTCSEDGSTLR